MAIACGVSPAAGEWPKTITVCEVLKDPVRYNGKMVAVRGRVVSTGEGTWLIGEGCTDTIETAGYKWSASIWLESRKGEALHEVDFSRDEVAFTKFAALLKSKGDDGSKKLVATYLGLFETYEDLAQRIVKYPSGELKGVGFGHLDSAPGQLIVRSVSLTDVQVSDVKP